MMDDGMVFCFGCDVFCFVCGEDITGLWLCEQVAAGGFDVRIRDVIDVLCNFAVQGLKSREFLIKILWIVFVQLAIGELGWFRFVVACFGGFVGILLVVLCIGCIGELGFELWCVFKDGLVVWQVVMEVGVLLGIVLLGFDVLDMLCIEVGFVFVGYEFCDQIDPFEVGIGFMVAFFRFDDFIGKVVLEECKVYLCCKLVGFAIVSNELAVYGDGFYVGCVKVGEIISTVCSPVLDVQIVLVRVDVAYSVIDIVLQVGQLDGYCKWLDAMVVVFFCYDLIKLCVWA